MRTLSAATLCLFLAAANVHPDGYTLDLIGDGALLLGGVGSAALTEFLLHSESPALPGTGDISAVNPFDRLAVFPYSEGLDITSSVLQYSCASVPVLFAFFLPIESMAEIGVVYTEALSWAFSLENLLKYLIPRERPYVYSGLMPAPGSASADWNQSFPSGHSAIAFTAATCSLFFFDTYFPSSPYLLAFGIANYTAAVFAAAFRVTSGLHFMTDVAAGAVIGIACGYLIPLIHKTEGEKQENRGVSLAVTVDGFSVTLEL
jgi:membrane-associated phospholipid phosphatase